MVEEAEIKVTSFAATAQADEIAKLCMELKRPFT
jgi:hypothetical protein